MVITLVFLTRFHLVPSALSAGTALPSGPPRDCDLLNNGDVSGFRTTQNIVWSCLVTIFACVWFALHPNLPDPRSSGWSRFKRRVGIMLLAAFAPEFILVWALRQRIGAKSIMNEYNRVILGVSEDEKTLAQRVRDWFHTPPPSGGKPVWTLAHGFYVQMGGFLLYDKDVAVRVLHFHELLYLIPSGMVDLPNFTEEEIWDKSKGDFFAKSLALIQTTWFIVQCVARWAAGLRLTELEDVTLSFAALNIITHCLWWAKPQNVDVGLRIQMKERAVERQREVLAAPPGVEEGDIADYRWTTDTRKELYSHPHYPAKPPGVGSAQGTNEVFPQPIWKRSARSITQYICYLVQGTVGFTLFHQLGRVVLGSAPMLMAAPTSLTVETFYAYDVHYPKIGLIIATVISGALFGGLHLIPWKYAFPTYAESLLWRISSLYIMLNPVMLSFPLFLTLVAHGESSGIRRDIRSALYRVFRPRSWTVEPFRFITGTVPLYILARLLLICLAFVTLRSLPSDAYQEISWSSFLPHV